MCYNARVNAPGFDLLLLGRASGFCGLPDLAGLDSELGCYRIACCESLDEAAGDPARRADVALVAATAGELPAWLASPALEGLAARAALVVVCDQPPDAPSAVRLIAIGGQDLMVAPDIATLRRTLRLAIERRAREREAGRASTSDLLTGLPNQTQLVEHVSQLLALREREPAPMVVIVLRIEGLGAVQGEFGVEATHALRRKLAVRLRSAIRAGDVIASIATDRFAVLLPHVQSADDGAHVADKLVAAVSSPIGLSGRLARVSAAAGIAQYPRDGKDAAVLLRVAGDLAAASPAGGAPHRIRRPEAANDD